MDEVQFIMTLKLILMLLLMRFLGRSLADCAYFCGSFLRG